MAANASPRRPPSNWDDQRTPHSPAQPPNGYQQSPRSATHLPYAPHPPRVTAHHNDVNGHNGGEDPLGGSFTRDRIEGARRAAATLEFEEDADVDPDLRERIEKGLVDPSDIAQPTSEDLDIGPRQIVRRKVKKLVEVPVTRKVKVPVVEQKVVPDIVRTKVKVKKQIQVQEWKVVEEAYTEVEEQPATRMKEVWIKKLVPETYMKRVEVRKVRMTKVPMTVTKEIEEEAEVSVETTKVIDVHSFRIDEVKDTKLMELEGWQELELVPRVKDSSIKIDRSRELERRKRRIERKQGHEVLNDNDNRLDQIDTDSDPSDNEANVVKSEGRVPLDGTEHRTRPRSNHRNAQPSSHRATGGRGGVSRR